MFLKEKKSILDPLDGSADKHAYCQASWSKFNCRNPQVEKTVWHENPNTDIHNNKCKQQLTHFSIYG